MQMRLCIVQPEKDALSETFLKAHAQYLQGRIDVLYGGFVPVYFGGGRALSTLVPLPVKLLRRILVPDAGLRVRQAFMDFLQKQAVDVVLAEYGPTGVALMAICREVNVPLVVHFHGADAYDAKWLGGPGRDYPALFQNAAAIVAVSHAMELQLLRLGAPRDKLWYNPYGVDTSAITATQPAAMPPHFVAVGRLVDKKAPILTLLAFRDVWRKIPEARLSFIGEGLLAESCRQMTKVLGIEGAVEWMGARPHRDVLDLMRRARAFVQHSVTTASGDSEGTPVAVLEAQASGLPVVATRHGGIPDVVINEETGFLVDEYDVDGMSSLMLRLAVDPDLAAQLGAAGRRRIEENFSMTKRIGVLQSILETAVSPAMRR
jgi:glycosyltransferase involved in cell wall biosynthesis